MLSADNGTVTTENREKTISEGKRRRQRTGRHKSFRLAEMREHLGDVVNLAAYAGERVVLTRYGRPVVAVVPLKDMEWLDTAAPKKKPRY